MVPRHTMRRRSARARAVPASSVAVLFLAGCVTSSEGEAMRAETIRLKERIDDMDNRYAKATQDMDRLRKVVDEASALLTRNSADLGTRVEQHGEDLRGLQGKLEEIRHLVTTLETTVQTENQKIASRVDAIELRQAALIEKVSPTLPTDPEALWREANAKLNQGLREDARRFFASFATRFPADPRASKAQLAIGKSYALDGNHRQAAGTFQKILDDFPRSADVPEAMYELGRSFTELKFCSDARAIFLDVAKRFPRSSFARSSREQAAAVRKLQDDKTRCTS